MRELSLIHSLVRQINGEEFDAIMCCGRGGLIPAAYLSHALGIKTVHHLTYPRSGKTAGMRTKEAKFLIVDDISDTGETFKRMLDTLGPNHKTACLYQRYSTSFQCDYVGEHINHDKWIEFSWEGHCE